MAHGNLKWIELPEPLARELGDGALSLDAMAAGGRAALVKSNSQRTVHRVHLIGLEVHVKQCRVTGWRAWLREWLRPAKAQLEYANLVTALGRNVPTIQPLGYAVARSLWPGPSFLVTHTVPGAIALDKWLSGPGKDRAAAERFILTTALGRLLARAHHGGVLHRDLHPGNVLICWDSAEPELLLLDLHDARIGSPASRSQSLANLVLLNRWFILRCSRSDRLRFWRTYIVERSRLSGGCVVDYFDARKLEQTTWESNQRFWHTRTSRCLGTNRRFQRVRGPGTAGFAVSEWSVDELAPLLHDPDAMFTSDNGPLLKDSRSSTVAIRTLTISGVPRQVVCKRFRCHSPIEAAVSLLRSPPCRRAWVNGHAFLDSLLPTPRPLALIQRRRFGLSHDGYLITEFIPDAIDLHQALRTGPDGTRRRRIHLIARLVRELHQRGWSHRDLKAANVLLAPEGAVEKAWLIDLAGADRPRRLTRGRRVKDLARLSATFHDSPQLSRTDRLRFLRMYLNAALHGQADWKSWWKQIGRRVLGKVAKNLRSGRPLA